MKVLCVTTSRHLNFTIADSSNRQIRTVYILQCELSGRMKIGITYNTSKRLTLLRLMSPTKLTLFASFNTIDDQLESFLHERYSSCRSHGEWFQPDQCMLDDLSNFKSFWESKTATLENHKDFPISSIEELNNLHALDLSVASLKSQGLNIDYFKNIPLSSFPAMLAADAC